MMGYEMLSISRTTAITVSLTSCQSLT